MKLELRKKAGQNVKMTFLVHGPIATLAYYIYSTLERYSEIKDL